MPWFLGLDLGGTNIKAGLSDERGNLRSRCARPTPRTNFDAVAAALGDAAVEAVKAAGLNLADVAAAGVGTPGLVDTAAGVVRDAPNLPGFQNAPLGDALARRLGCRVLVENDANAAAYGEFWAGAGRRGAGRGEAVRDLVMLTLGTGVGGGIVSDGRVLHGCRGLAAEVGHMIVTDAGRPCACGQRGCLEAYASAGAVAARAAEAVTAGQSTILSKHVGPLTAEVVFAAARQGDAPALCIVQQAADALGVACVNLCRLLDPQMIVLGGGMAEAGDFLLDRVRAAYAGRNWSLAGATAVRIEAAVLGNDAGMIGAAGIACNACGT